MSILAGQRLRPFDVGSAAAAGAARSSPSLPKAAECNAVNHDIPAKIVEGMILVRGHLTRPWLKGKNHQQRQQYVYPVKARVRLRAETDAVEAAAAQGALANKTELGKVRQLKSYNFRSRVYFGHTSQQSQGPHSIDSLQGDLEEDGVLTVHVADASSNFLGNASPEDEKDCSDAAVSEGNVWERYLPNRGSITGRLLQPYVRQETRELLLLSDFTGSGEAWRILPELQRLLVLRQGFLCYIEVSCGAPQQRQLQEQRMQQVKSVRDCLVRLALLKKSCADVAHQLLLQEDAGDAYLHNAVAATLPVPAPHRQTQQHRQQSPTARRCNFFDAVWDSLKLATSYATTGNSFPAVYLQMGAFRPAILYDLLSRCEVQLLLLHVFERLWLSFAAFSLRRGVFVSSAALVLDFSDLTEAELTSSALHWLMNDLRLVLRAVCPLLVHSLIFFGCRRAHQYLWELLKPAVDVDGICIHFCESESDLASHVKSERPFIYHTLLTADDLDVPMLRSTSSSRVLRRVSPLLLMASPLQMPIEYICSSSTGGSNSSSRMILHAMQKEADLLSSSTSNGGSCDWLMDAEEDLLLVAKDEGQRGSSRCTSMTKDTDRNGSTAVAGKQLLSERARRLVSIAALALTPLLDGRRGSSSSGDPYDSRYSEVRAVKGKDSASRSCCLSVQCCSLPAQNAFTQVFVDAVQQLWMAIQKREALYFWEALSLLQQRQLRKVQQRQKRIVKYAPQRQKNHVECTLENQKQVDAKTTAADKADSPQARNPATFEDEGPLSRNARVSVPLSAAARRREEVADVGRRSCATLLTDNRKHDKHYSFQKQQQQQRMQHEKDSPYQSNFISGFKEASAAERQNRTAAVNHGRGLISMEKRWHKPPTLRIR